MASKTWTGATSDDWNTASNWSPAQVPQAGDSITINAGLTNEPTILFGATASLTAGADIYGTLTIDDNAIAFVGGAIANLGTIALDSSDHDTELRFANGTTLWATTGYGARAIALSDSPDNIILGAANTGSEVVTNVDNTIKGSGQLGYGNSLEFINESGGTVDASGIHASLQITPTVNSAAVAANGGGFVNQGLLEATNTAGLVLNGGQINNNGGTILAAGAGDNVYLQSGVTLSGGTLSGGGLVETVSGNAATLNGVTIEGTYQASDNSTTYLEGAINNQGTIWLASAGNTVDLRLEGGQTVTLTGGGVVSLDASSHDFIRDANLGTGTLINVNNDIQGSGHIGNGQMAIDNQAQGVIDATDAGATLDLEANAAGFTNEGTIEATRGVIGINGSNGGAITQSGAGKILATGSGSTVELYDNAIVSGGTLNGESGGVVATLNGNTATLDGVTNAPGSTYQANDNSATYLEGAINNQGTIWLTSAGNDASLRFSDGLTLSGGGTIALSDSADNLIFGALNTGSEVVANVNDTIAGSGQFGALNSFEFLNGSDGTIDATGTAASLVISPTTQSGVTSANGGGFVNQGLLEATNTAGLVLNGGQINNNGGTILAAGVGDNVYLQSGVTVSGGTLNGENGGLVETLNGNAATLNGVTIEGNYQTNNNSATNLENAIDNTGTIQLNSSGNTTQLSVMGGVTLSGGGVIALGDNADNVILAAAGGGTLANVDNTIEGAGQISGANGLSLFNEGTIVATFADQALILATGQAVTNDGFLEANGGRLVVNDAVTGSGSVSISGGGDASFTAAFSQNTTFEGADAGTLTLAQPYSGVVSDFSAGDEIDLTGVAYAAGDHFVYESTIGGVQNYDLENASNTPLASLNFNGTYATGDFTIGQDSGTGTQIGFLPIDAKMDLFAGGATSDVLLQNSAGTMVDWIVNNGAITAGNNLGTNPGWNPVGTGDFTGNGVSDILMQNSSGTIVDWTMQNGTVSAAAVMGNTVGFNIVGTGDFTGNGIDDILLQNSAGTIVDWIVSNGAITAGNNLGTNPGWNVVGTGDFNGDGTTDVLLENSTGTVVDWTMGNGTVAGAAVIGNASGYDIVGTGDFTGNGTTDILLQNAAGDLVDWIMSNGAITGAHDLGVNPGWSVEATGDYTGNGISDILLTNSAGAVVDWTISNGVVSNGALIGHSAGFTVKH